jgi:hypothetical protein
MTSNRPETSMIVATRLAPIDSEIPRAFSAASSPRNTITTRTVGRVMNSER